MTTGVGGQKLRDINYGQPLNIIWITFFSELAGKEGPKWNSHYFFPFVIKQQKANWNDSKSIKVYFNYKFLFANIGWQELFIPLHFIKLQRLANNFESCTKLFYKQVDFLKVRNVIIPNCYNCSLLAIMQRLPTCKIKVSTPSV